MSDTATEARGITISHEALLKLGNGDAREGRHMLQSWVKSETGAQPVMGPTDRPATVRIANESDELALLDLMLLDVRENALPIAQPNPERIMDHIHMGTRRTGGILGVIDGPDGKPIGSILLVFFQWWWSEARFIQEVWCYVHPDHRKSRHAEDLMKFARWVSDDMTRGFGYRVWLFQGVTALAHTRKKIRFYGRFTNYVGAFFVYPKPGG